MILGLFFGTVACTWAFSGMLSMDPFPARAPDEAGRARVSRALRGGEFQLSAFTKHPREALAQVAVQLPVRVLDFTFFAGEAVYLATAGSRDSRIIFMRGEPKTGFAPDRIIDLAGSAAGPGGVAEARLVTEYDAYYLDRHRQLPLPVVLVRFHDTERSTYYIDPHTARIVGVYGSRLWFTRWFYHGLHSIDLPWLYKHRPAWDMVVLLLLLGGTSLTITAVILAWRLLRAKL